MSKKLHRALPSLGLKAHLWPRARTIVAPPLSSSANAIIRSIGYDIPVPTSPCSDKRQRHAGEMSERERIERKRARARYLVLGRSSLLKGETLAGGGWGAPPPPPPPPPLRPPPGARQICACGPRSLALVWSLYALRVNPSLGNAESVRCITAALFAFGVAPFSRRQSDVEVVSSLV